MAKKPKQRHQPTRAAMNGTHAANASATKRGPGRYHRGGKPGNRLTKARKPRAYVALCEAWSQKRVINWKGGRDEHGAYTLVGKPYELIGVHPSSREVVLRGGVDPDGGFDYTVQRKWLAGLSAQRGY